MAKGSLLVLAVVCSLAAIATAKFANDGFRVTGCLYCDTCNCGFETDATHYDMPDCEVKIECRDRKTNAITYTKPGKTGPNGCYEIIVESDRGDDNCNVVLGKSSKPQCSKKSKGRDRGLVVLTRNNGLVSRDRHVNPLGYDAAQKLPNCQQVLQKYQLSQEIWRI